MVIIKVGGVWLKRLVQNIFWLITARGCKWCKFRSNWGDCKLPTSCKTSILRPDYKLDKDYFEYWVK